MIWLSEKRDFFMQNLPVFSLRKILLLNTPVFRGDYLSTCCPAGPTEILGNREFGELVPVDDVDALAKVIDRVLEGPVEHGRLKRRAQDFSVDEILASTWQQCD